MTYFAYFWASDWKKKRFLIYFIVKK
jgi:hypothetical protein